MITREQLDAGCKVWLVFNGEVRFSRYNLDNSKHARPAVLNDPIYFTSKQEAEMYLLECKLNDN